MCKEINSKDILNKWEEELEDRVFISGRSIGDINVQIILEKLGGGGHITLAGAQLEGLTLEENIEISKHFERSIAFYTFKYKIASISTYIFYNHCPVLIYVVRTHHLSYSTVSEV